MDDKSSRIRIFSKSKRDSTQDRYAVHDIIRRALRLSPATLHSEAWKGSISKNVIIDAEMVAFRGDEVDGKPYSHMLSKLQIFDPFRRVLAYSTID